MARCLQLRECLALSIMIELIPRVAAAQSHVPSSSCLLPSAVEGHAGLTLYRFHFKCKNNPPQKTQQQQKGDFGPTSLPNSVIRTREEEGSPHVLHTLGSCEQSISDCVLAVKAHFLESLLLVVTSVTGWTLPASRRFGAFPYDPIDSFQLDLQLHRWCFFFFPMFE